MARASKKGTVALRGRADRYGGSEDEQGISHCEERVLPAQRAISGRRRLVLWTHLLTYPLSP